MENTSISSAYQVTIDDLSWGNVCTIASNMDVGDLWITIAQEVITFGYHKGIIDTLDQEDKESSTSSPSQRLLQFLQKMYPNTKLSSIMNICLRRRRMDMVQLLQNLIEEISTNGTSSMDLTDEIEWEGLSQQPKRARNISNIF